MEALETVPETTLNPNRPRPNPKQKLALALRFAVMVFFTLSTGVFLWTARWFEPFFGRKYYRRVCDFSEGAWFDALFLLLGRTHLHVYGQHRDLHNDPSDQRPRIVISNHTTDVDWLYLWMLAQTCDPPKTGNVKVMLKAGIRDIPFFGWVLDQVDFVWMKRNWEKDRQLINDHLNRLCLDGEDLWILMFPEGMTMNTRSSTQCQEFAREELRPQLEFTLLPRYKGLSALLDCTKHLNPEIVDVTMAFDSYSGEVPTWEMCYERNNDHRVPNLKKLLAGMSGDAHLDVRRFDARDVLSHTGGVKGWLDDRWKRKDAILKHFIRNEAFPRDDYQYEVKTPLGSLSKIGAMTLCDIVTIIALWKVAFKIITQLRLMISKS